MYTLFQSIYVTVYFDRHTSSSFRIIKFVKAYQKLLTYTLSNLASLFAFNLQTEGGKEVRVHNEMTRSTITTREKSNRIFMNVAPLIKTIR